MWRNIVLLCEWDIFLRAFPLSTIWTSAFVVKTLALAGLLVFFISLRAMNSVLELLLIRQSHPRYHSVAVPLSI